MVTIDLVYASIANDNLLCKVFRQSTPDLVVMGSVVRALLYPLAGSRLPDYRTGLIVCQWRPAHVAAGDSPQAGRSDLASLRRRTSPGDGYTPVP